LGCLATHVGQCCQQETAWRWKHVFRGAFLDY
jgi:hypothetical protein